MLRPEPLLRPFRFGVKPNFDKTAKRSIVAAAFHLAAQDMGVGCDVDFRAGFERGSVRTITDRSPIASRFPGTTTESVEPLLVIVTSSEHKYGRGLKLWVMRAKEKHVGFQSGRASTADPVRPYGMPPPSVAARGQYRGTDGSTIVLHASIPPAMLWQALTPCSRNQCTTLRLRTP